MKNADHRAAPVGIAYWHGHLNTARYLAGEVAGLIIPTESNAS